MSATGQNTSNTTNNTNSFISALVIGLVVAGVYLVVFFLLHAKNRRVYQSRTLVAPEGKRPSVLPDNPIKWFSGIIFEPDIRVFEMNGPDAYFFVRFCRFMVLLLLPYWGLTWVVLMPLSAAPPNLGAAGLNMFTFGNVTVFDRRAGHLIVFVLLLAWSLYMIYREYEHFLELRQAYLNSPAHAATARSRTVMVNNLPKNVVSEERVRELAAFVPGPVERVWMPRAVKPLQKLYDARNNECLVLEKAETNLSQMASKNVRKNKLPEKAAAAEDAGLTAKYVPEKKLPSHKIGTLADYTFGLFGKKVDTLSYSPAFIKEQDEQLILERQNVDSYKLANSAFIRFTSQADAHFFAQQIKKNTLRKDMVGASTEVVPEDIIWSNLSMSPYERLVRTIISWCATIGLIIAWAPLVAFVGVISNVSTLCSSVSFLSWICRLPSTVVGIIQGILPPVLLAILFMLLPIVLRIFVKMQGEPRNSTVQRKLWSRFWLFQIIHGFLIVALASGLVSALQNIKETASEAPTLLANHLPDSAIFFLTFILTVVLGSASKTLSRAIPWVMSKLAFIFRGSTPRKAYAYDWKMDSIELATEWPPVALLGIIGIVYSVIQPVTVGFAAVGFYLLYMTYKYMLIWNCDQPENLETGGLYYPKALGAVFAALYIEEICLGGLFFLSGPGAGAIGWAGGAIIALCLAVTAVFEVWVEWRFARLYTFVGPSAGPGMLAGLEKSVSEEDDAQPYPGSNNASSEQDAPDPNTHAFDHPALWKPTPLIWLAADTLGIAQSETARLEGEGLRASTEYASMDEKGKVTVLRGPPDEPWLGGQVE
ncbi:DUF221-domain-containing protein [Dacryopinax primogenitus]|uniref:DUF221-domain-containing protein n=1 Tax=Dacryopinax primogenitus (strain DJM 731) TaxID=1858805 RepID=M5FV09_DACPD|nr:DUF221-domain-containing protein [Dacryopinax primogenitus]EJU00089.1 DUF221-domain-containing protein [Dacryopinax primogenitus]